MPFDPNNPPVKKVKGLSKLTEKQQRQWVHAWNSAYERAKEKNKGKPPTNEERLYKIAWGAVRRKRRAAIALALLPKDHLSDRWL